MARPICNQKLAKAFGQLTDAEKIELTFLVQRVLCDHRPEGRDPYAIVCIYGVPADSADASYRRAVELVRKGQTRRLAVTDGPNPNYQGYEYSYRRLVELGLPDNRTLVEKLTVRGAVLHTGNESDALASYVRDVLPSGIDIGILSADFQRVRAFVTAVSKIDIMGVPSRVYAVPPRTLSWCETAMHSPGIEPSPRFDLLEGEILKLIEYRAQQFGSLYTPEQVFDYLDWRDQ